MQSHARRYFWLVIGVPLFALAAARLLGFVVWFGQSSVQMDFAAYYTAGEALNSGLSPYHNYVEHEPPVWDGLSLYRHSRFLYPPLVASLFRPAALLPYLHAKYLWMGLNLACVVAALAVASQVLRVRFTLEYLLALGSLVALYHPLLALLETGQLDGVTLLLVTGAVFLMVSRRGTGWAGLLLALATLFKLHNLFFLPFLLLARQWRAAGAYLSGLLALVLLTVVVNGPEALVGYARDELPRISAYGSLGPDTLRLPEEVFQRAWEGLPPGTTVKDGRRYPFSAFAFVSNATLVGTSAADLARGVGRNIGIIVTNSMLSLLFFALIFGGVLAWGRVRELDYGKLEGARGFAYWQGAFVVVLLCGPFTWVMNTVWLLPVAVLAWQQSPLLRGRGAALSLALCLLGLLAAAIPDHHGFAMALPYGRRVMEYKYVVAELLVFLGLMGFLADRTRSGLEGA